MIQDRVSEILARPDRARPRYRIVQPMREKPTPRQLMTISAVSHGMTLSDAAVILGCTRETCKSHMRDAKLRTAAKTTPHLVAICLREGWIP
jgi:DNA-binding CsgD family transcriptional regulator